MDDILTTITKTTNYYPFKFNKTTECREILFEGGVPLHKIIYHLYDFYYDYVHSASPNTITYLSLIINQNSNSRPETPYIIKLEGASSKKKRQANIKSSITDIIALFNKVFRLFITEQGMEKEDYRTDTNFNTLKKSYTDFNNEVSPKLLSLMI